MVGDLKEITQIALAVLEAGEKLHEVVIVKPIGKKEIRALAPYSEPPSPLTKLWTKIVGLGVRLLPAFGAREKRTQEAKFQAFLAYLLTHDELSWLQTARGNQEALSESLKSAANTLGFTLDWPLDPSLFDIKKRELASLGASEKERYLSALTASLTNLDLSSQLVIHSEKDPKEIKIISLTKSYKIAVEKIKESGEILFSTSSKLESLKGLRRTEWQAGDKNEPDRFSKSTSLPIFKPSQVTEMFLALFPDHESSRFILKSESSEGAKELAILFTSLFSVSKLSEIFEEKRAVEALSGKGLEVIDASGKMQTYRLNFIYLNVIFSASPRLFLNQESVAQIEDISDLALLRLALRALKMQGQGGSLYEIEKQLLAIDRQTDFFFKQKEMLFAIDHFRANKMKLLEELSHLRDPYLIDAFGRLFSEKMGEKERFLAFSFLAERLSMHHHTTAYDEKSDPLSLASALQKADLAFTKLSGSSSIFAKNREEKELFDLFTQLYLDWEEKTLSRAHLRQISGL